jgi:hypothetical protein
MLPPNMVPSAWDDVEIDWSHPLAQGLAFLILFNSGNAKDVITQTTGTPSGVSVGTNYRGVGSYSTGGQYLMPSTLVPNLGATNNLTVFACGVFNGAPTGEAGIISFKGTNSNSWFDLEINGGSGNKIRMEPFSGSFSDIYGSTSLTTGQNYAAGSVLTGSSCEIWLNGLLDNSASYSATLTALNATGQISICKHDVFYNPGLITNIHYYTIPLSHGLMAWLAAEPFAMLKPKKTISYYFASLSAYQKSSFFLIGRR